MWSPTGPRPFWRVLPAVLGLLLLWASAVWAQGPTNDQLKQIELGARLYAENCAVCHGPRGEGRFGATLAKNWPSIRPELRIKETIEKGVPGSPMPAWSQKHGGPLTDEEIEALVLYILSWETGGLPPLSPTPTFTPRPPITPVPNVEGDPNRGAILYAQNCAVCHGPNGEGRIGATLARAWPSIRPDLRVKETIVRGVPGSPMPAWSQENGGPLSNEDINDIVAFILSWSATAPTPLQPSMGRPTVNVGLIVGAIVVILLIISGGVWYSRKQRS